MLSKSLVNVVSKSFYYDSFIYKGIYELVIVGCVVYGGINPFYWMPLDYILDLLSCYIRYYSICLFASLVFISARALISSSIATSCMEIKIGVSLHE